MASRGVMGIDIGRSAVKTAYRIGEKPVRTDIFSSIAEPAREITEDREARLAERDTVTVGKRNYFVRDTAAIQGDLSRTNQLAEDWVYSDEYKALLLAAIQPFEQQDIRQRLVVMGLPVKDFRRQHQTMKEMASDLLDAEIKVVPQSFAAYNRFLLTDEGRIGNLELMDESHAMLDVGRYSSDIILMKKGRWVEQAAASTRGMFESIRRLQDVLSTKMGFSIRFEEAESAMIEGFIKHEGELLDIQPEVQSVIASLADRIVSELEEKLGDELRRLDRILLSGGGSVMLTPALSKKWKHVTTLDNSRMANAEGMYRIGCSIIAARESENVTA